MPFIPSFIQALFASASPAQAPAQPRMKRKGSKLAMIFASISNKRERTNSKATDDHEIVQFDEDIAAIRASRDAVSNAVRSSRNEDEASTNEDKRKSKNLSKVPSKLKILFTKGERPHFIAMTDEMIRLETVIQSEKGRKKLIDELLVLKGDFSVKVRFCYAIEQFDNCVGDDRERAALALSLIDMFVRDGGMFHVALSEVRKQAILVDGNFNQLLDAKREVLDELSKNENVMKFVNMVEALDGV